MQTEQCKTTFLPLTSNWLNMGTTPKDASKKRKSTDQSKPGNESGGELSDLLFHDCVASCQTELTT